MVDNEVDDRRSPGAARLRAVLWVVAFLVLALWPQSGAAFDPSSALSEAETETSAAPMDQPLRVLPDLPAGYTPWWVSNFQETELWSGPEETADVLGPVPQFRRFLVVEPQKGDWLRVWSPEQDLFGYLDAAVLGPSGPSVWMDARLPKVVGQAELLGRSTGKLRYVRNLPVHADETELRPAPHNMPLFAREVVAAADGSEWYAVADDEYVAASEVRLPRPVESFLPGRWIDADLAEPAMVTAYEGDRIAYTALAVKGTPTFPTPKGTFTILRRVENETMDSATLGIPVDGPGGYYLKNVLYTQYFTPNGASLHYNYWLGTLGYAGSHGCLGLSREDSRWFWEWATVGTPVVIR